jgi:anti-sigma regulatory factor (Ser/Thr protein kinase)
MAERPTDPSTTRTGTPDGSGSGWADPHEVALDQTFDASNLYALRSAVAAHGASFGLTEHRLGELVLVAHELAANAVRHGGARPASPGRLRLWRDGDDIVCEVSDAGPGLVDPATAGTEPVGVGAYNGRGLWIVRQIADRVDIDSADHGVTITVAMGPTAG